MPLTYLLGYSELLTRQKDLPEAAQSHVKEIHAEALHMSQLVEKLLELSRFETGNVRLGRDHLDIAALVQRAFDRISSKPKTSHQFVLRNSTDSLETVGDPDRLMEVIDNLLESAIKYSPNGGLVILTTSRDGEYIEVSVSDDGAGIPVESQQHIFQEFFRAQSTATQNIHGSGLGLNVCKYIIEAHGGRIWFDSREGYGSTFYFSIPVARS